MALFEWAKFLEKINKGLPMLISKIEGHTPQRSSLERTRKVLSNYFDSCFYCNRFLPQDKRSIHVDHFIPWSYIYEDEVWNLVLSCRECNLRKHGSLPSEDYIEHLLKRDLEYFDKIDFLKKSLLKLDPQNHYESAIRKHS
ncbi:MAG: HNH endonuclease [Nitrososphaeraceae archaeon]